MQGTAPLDPKAPLDSDVSKQPSVSEKPSVWRRTFAAGVGLATLLALAAMLGYSVHFDDRGADAYAAAPPASEIAVRASAPETSTGAAVSAPRLAELESKLEELGALVGEAEGASSRLSVRIQQLERAEKRRARSEQNAAAATPREEKAASASPVPAKLVPAEPAPRETAAARIDLEPFEKRLFSVEKSMQSEGRARVSFQEKIDQRLFDIEQLRDRSDVRWAEAQTAVQERLYNLEQRIQGLEERTLAFERKVLTALEQANAPR